MCVCARECSHEIYIYTYVYRYGKDGAALKTRRRVCSTTPTTTQTTTTITEQGRQDDEPRAPSPFVPPTNHQRWFSVFPRAFIIAHHNRLRKRSTRDGDDGDIYERIKCLRRDESARWKTSKANIYITHTHIWIRHMWVGEFVCVCGMIYETQRKINASNGAEERG